MWKIGVVAAIGLAIAPVQAGHHRVVRRSRQRDDGLHSGRRYSPALQLSSAGLATILRKAHVWAYRDEPSRDGFVHAEKARN